MDKIKEVLRREINIKRLPGINIGDICVFIACMVVGMYLRLLVIGIGFAAIVILIRLGVRKGNSLRCIIITCLIMAGIHLLLFFSLGNVFAKDFGSYGKTYPIIEADIEQEIARKLSIYQENGELEKFQKNYQREVTKQIKNPSRVIGISDATENRVRVFDPTTYLEEDIIVPKTGVEDAKQNPEAIEYQVLYKAGTAINPLNYMKFNEPLIFVDGNNEKQLQYGRDYQDNNPLAKIILIDGSPGFKEINGKEYQYFFDQRGAYSQRFKIVKVPSVVYQKEQDTNLIIEEVNLTGAAYEGN